jgi:hypothetical protein
MKSVFGTIAALIGAGALTLFVAGIAAGYGRIAPPIVAFGITALGMLTGVLALVLAAFLALRTGMNPRTAIALLGAIPAVVLAYSLVSARGAPPINDITTDRVYPPAFTHAQTLPANSGRDMAYPESFKATVEKAYPDLQSLGLAGKRDDVFAEALDLAKSREGWEVTSTAVTGKESVVEGTATSRVFGFVDDFVIRITDAGEGVVVDMRSKSRDGKGDLGANAARIRAFFGELQG